MAAKNTTKLLWIFSHWIPFAILTIFLCGLIELTVQQNFRQNANDPQIQQAEDTAAFLSGGGNVQSILSQYRVDVSESLAPFMIIFDSTGKAVASNAVLHGQLPTLPQGVLSYTQKNREDRITWQPEAGVRIAAVVVRFSGKESGYMLVGRSLREVEKREDALFTFTAIGAVGILIALLFTVGILAFF